MSNERRRLMALAVGLFASVTGRAQYPDDFTDGAIPRPCDEGTEPERTWDCEQDEPRCPVSHHTHGGLMVCSGASGDCTFEHCWHKCGFLCERDPLLKGVWQAERGVCCYCGLIRERDYEERKRRRHGAFAPVERIPGPWKYDFSQQVKE